MKRLNASGLLPRSSLPHRGTAFHLKKHRRSIALNREQTPFLPPFCQRFEEEHSRSSDRGKILALRRRTATTVCRRTYEKPMILIYHTSCKAFSTPSGWRKEQNWSCVPYEQSHSNNWQTIVFWQLFWTRFPDDSHRRLLAPGNVGADQFLLKGRWLTWHYLKEHQKQCWIRFQLRNVPSVRNPIGSEKKNGPNSNLKLHM